MTSSRSSASPAPSQAKPGRDGRRIVLLLFGVYLLLLIWLVLWKLELPHVGTGGWRPVKLVPFVPTADAGASALSEVLANIAIFVPFGVYLGLLAPRWPWWRAASTFAVGSLTLEAAQYVLAVGSADITDVLTNTAGGLAGIGLIALARENLQVRTAAVMTRVCSIGTVVALLAIVALVASPVRFTQPDFRSIPSHSVRAG